MSYFTTAELRTLPQMSDTAKYPDEIIAIEQAYIEGLIERVCGTSFVGTPVTEALDGTGYAEIVLRQAYALDLGSIVVDGASLTSGELAELTLLPGGVVRKPLGGFWPWGKSNVVVSYTAGYSFVPPADLKGAAMKATRDRLINGATAAKVSDRATSYTNENGQVNLSVANADNRPTGLPEVDAVIIGWRDKLNVLGFA